MLEIQIKSISRLILLVVFVNRLSFSSVPKNVFLLLILMNPLLLCQLTVLMLLLFLILKNKVLILLVVLLKLLVRLVMILLRVFGKLFLR